MKHYELELLRHIYKNLVPTDKITVINEVNWASPPAMHQQKPTYIKKYHRASPRCKTEVRWLNERTKESSSK